MPPLKNKFIIVLNKKKEERSRESPKRGDEALKRAV